MGRKNYRQICNKDTLYIEATNKSLQSIYVFHYLYHNCPTDYKPLELSFKYGLTTVIKSIFDMFFL